MFQLILYACVPQPVNHYHFDKNTCWFFYEILTLIDEPTLFVNAQDDLVWFSELSVK